MEFFEFLKLQSPQNPVTFSFMKSLQNFGEKISTVTKSESVLKLRSKRTKPVLSCKAKMWPSARTAKALVSTPLPRSAGGHIGCWMTQGTSWCTTSMRHVWTRQNSSGSRWTPYCSAPLIANIRRPAGMSFRQLAPKPILIHFKKDCHPRPKIVWKRPRMKVVSLTILRGTMKMKWAQWSLVISALFSPMSTSPRVIQVKSIWASVQFFVTPKAKAFSRPISKLS